MPNPWTIIGWLVLLALVLAVVVVVAMAMEKQATAERERAAVKPDRVIPTDDVPSGAREAGMGLPS